MHLLAPVVEERFNALQKRNGRSYKREYLYEALVCRTIRISRTTENHLFVAILYV